MIRMFVGVAVAEVLWTTNCAWADARPGCTRSAAHILTGPSRPLRDVGPPQTMPTVRAAAISVVPAPLLNAPHPP